MTPYGLILFPPLKWEESFCYRNVEIVIYDLCLVEKYENTKKKEIKRYVTALGLFLSLCSFFNIKHQLVFFILFSDDTAF